MRMERGSGIIMHIASLPGKYGIGTFGKEAYKFADFLKSWAKILANTSVRSNKLWRFAVSIIFSICWKSIFH